MLSGAMNPTSVKRDFLVADDERLFPAHGWSCNTQRRRVLRLPLLALLGDVWRYRAAAGLPDQLPTDKPFSSASENAVHVHAEDQPTLGVDGPVRLIAGRLSPEPLWSSLRHLIIALGKLHALGRQVTELPAEYAVSRQVFVDEMTDEAAIWTKFAILELRSLLDLLGLHLVPVLCKDWKEAARTVATFPHLGEYVQNVPQNLIVRPDGVREAFERSNSWFGRLRDPNGGHKGIRDQLVHSNCRIFVSIQGEVPGRREMYARIWPAGGPHSGDLLAELISLVAGFCSFCGDVTALCNAQGKYVEADCVSVFMSDIDQTAFWPALAPGDASRSGAQDD